MEEIDYSEYGNCPNCNAQWVHVSQLGRENGVMCCVNCYQDVRANAVKLFEKSKSLTTTKNINK